MFKTLSKTLTSLGLILGLTMLFVTPASATFPLGPTVSCAAVNTGEVNVAFDSGPMTVTGGTKPYTRGNQHG